MNKKLIIAIDGPAGSGKTTTSKYLAKKLGFIYIDTGAMYRAVALAWLQTGSEFDEESICSFLESISIELINTSDGQKTYLNGIDVSDSIRLPEVTKLASPLSAVKCVRTKLIDMQRQLGVHGNVVMDGRDIGTVVFPNADLKIFLTAEPHARAKRRTLELLSKGISANEEDVFNEMMTRDTTDSNRKESPLIKADDAIEIDTSQLSFEEQTDKIYHLALNLINY